MNTDTPRTNEWETYCDECYYHMWRVRRKNERGFDDGFHVHNGDEARALVDLLNKQDIELNEARAEMPWYANGESKEQWMERQREKYQHLENTIKEVTEQRDEAREVLREIRDNEVNPEDEADKFLRDHVPSELSKVREQRDRLAEALESIVGESAYEGLPELKQLAIEEALQSLTTNAQGDQPTV